MAMTRRMFCQVLGAAVVAAAAGGRVLLRKASPRHVLGALRPRSYRGGIKALNAEEVAQPACWRG
jgi:hypothetical protein